MLHIVTGKVNAGKTTRMKAIYLRQNGMADGIISEKCFTDGKFYGYRLARLRNGETVELAVLEQAYHGQFTEACRLGPFVFSAEAFLFGTDALRRLCANPAARTLFLDEAGPLELKGQGFAEILPVFLRSGKTLYITVRSDCLCAFLKKYKIADYHLITV